MSTDTSMKIKQSICHKHMCLMIWKKYHIKMSKHNGIYFVELWHEGNDAMLESFRKEGQSLMLIHITIMKPLVICPNVLELTGYLK